MAQAEKTACYPRSDPLDIRPLVTAALSDRPLPSIQLYNPDHGRAFSGVVSIGNYGGVESHMKGRRIPVACVLLRGTLRTSLQAADSSQVDSSKEALSFNNTVAEAAL